MLKGANGAVLKARAARPDALLKAEAIGRSVLKASEGGVLTKMVPAGEVLDRVVPAPEVYP